jgi:ATP-binding cassette subfamily F protein uup
VTSTLVFEGGGRIGEYVGGYSDAVRQRRARGSAAVGKPRAGKAAGPADATAAARPRKLSYKEQRELDALPATIVKLEAEQAELQAALGDPGFFRNNPSGAREAAERWSRLAEELKAAYARWEALESGTVSGAAVPGP